MKKFKKFESYLEWLSAKIARTMLLIKATTWNLQDGYKWACGLIMHIYNDNRMMMGYYSHRKRITDGFYNSIVELKVKPTAILGTSMSGIAPAASLAQKMGLPLIFNQNGKFIIFEKELNTNIQIRDAIKSARVRAEIVNKPLVIISTAPYAIPYGVQYANEFKAGFAYIRPSAKDHGKGQQIEGNIQEGSVAVIITHNYTRKDRQQIADIFGDKIILSDWCDIDEEIGYKTVSHLNNHNLVVIEDLLSTGGSSAYEVYQAREAGAVCNYCFSIFSYGFETCMSQFRGDTNITGKTERLNPPCKIDSLLYFDELIDEATRIKFFKLEIIQDMKKEINGFDMRYELEIVARQNLN